MRTQGLVNRGLVLGDVDDEVTLAAAAVTVAAVIRLAERAVLVHGTHRVVEVPERTRDKFVVLPRAVAVEEDRARTDVVALHVLVHEVHLGKALDVDVIGVVLALGVVAGGRADGIPGVLQPRLDFGSLCLHVGDALVDLAVLVIAEQVVAHLLDRDAVVARRPAAGLLEAFERELGIAAVGDRLFFVVVLLDHVAGLGHEGVCLGRDGIAALIFAVHPDVGRGGVLADAHLVGQVVSRAVTQQAAVETLGEQREFLGLRGIDAGELDLGPQGDVVRFFILRFFPGRVAAALHLGEHVLRAVDVDRAGALGVVVLIGIHLCDRVVAFALIDLDEDGLHGGRALVGRYLEGGRFVAAREGIGGLRPQSRRDGELTA